MNSSNSAFGKEKKVFEREQKIAHRIKLKKRLEKAKHKLNINVSKQDVQNDELVVTRNVKEVKHEVKKPDPAKKALEKAKQIQLAKEQAEFERKLKEKQRQKQFLETKKRRKDEKGLLFKKTKRGQPVLSNQIGHLLGKISKS